jgi:hypothetical protein
MLNSDGVQFPSVPYVALEGRAENLLRDHLLASADLAMGGTNVQVPTFNGTTPADVFHTQLGGSILWVERFFGDDVMVAGGGRVAALYYQHTFVNTDEVPPTLTNPMFYFTFSPGVTGLVGYEIFDWAHTELTARAHFVPYTVGEFRPMISVDVLGSIWFDF